MRSPNSFLVLILSFVSFVVSGPLHSTTHSSRLAKNPIAGRQFHYPRALVDVCADIDLSLLLDDVLGLHLGSLSGEICLCLSAFPLDLDLYVDLDLLVNLLGQTKLEALLQTLVESSGTQCTYPDHASSKCNSGNPCDFTCTDGFIKTGGECICPLPNSVCNGQCGSYPNGCSSALPRPPKMARKSIASSHKRGAPGSHSGGLLNLGADVSLTLGGSNHHPGSPGTTSGGSQPGSSGLDINGLVNVLLGSLDISGPILGGNQSSGLEANLYICIGAGVSGSQGLLDTIADVVNSLLSSLLGTTINCKVESSCSVPADNGAVAIDLQICGLSGGSLESTLDKTLKAVVDLLNGLLGDAKITTNCSVDGPGCPATPTLSSSNHPHPSPPTSVETPCPSVRPSPPSTPHSGLDLSGLLNVAPEQIEGILGDLGLTSGDYNLDAVVDLVVGVSVGLGDTLGSVDGLTSNVVDLVDEILDLLLGADVTTQPNPNPTSPPTHSHPGQGIVIDIDLGAVVNVTLSDTGDLVNGVVSAVSGVLVSLLDLDVTVNVDGGHACGCSGSGKASAKN